MSILWLRRVEGPGSLFDDGLTLCRDDFLRAPVQLGVLDEAIPVGEPGPTLCAAVGFFSLQKKQASVTLMAINWHFYVM